MRKRKTKLQLILLKRRMSQVELLELIKFNFPDCKLNSANLCKIINGKHVNYTIKTGLFISISLGLKITDVIEADEIIKLDS